MATASINDYYLELLQNSLVSVQALSTERKRTFENILYAWIYSNVFLLYGTLALYSKSKQDQ